MIVAMYICVHLVSASFHFWQRLMVMVGHPDINRQHANQCMSLQMYLDTGTVLFHTCGQFMVRYCHPFYPTLPLTKPAAQTSHSYAVHNMLLYCACCMSIVLFCVTLL